MHRVFLIVLCTLICACRLTTPTSPTTTNTTNTVSVTITPPPTPPTPPTPPSPPTPPTPPTPTPPGNGSPSTPLPLPTYGQQVLNDVAAANPALVAASCSSFGFLDLLVDTLRLRDARWGYVCHHSAGCSQVSGDAISYYGGSGTPVTGSQGIWVVDVIAAHCATNTPQWLVIGFEATRQWSSRGRF